MFPTFVTHQVPIEDSSQHLLSMKAHNVLNLEELDSGIHNFMMTHQIFVIQSDDQSIDATEIDNPADKKTDVIEQEKDFMFPSSVTQQVNTENDLDVSAWPSNNNGTECRNCFPNNRRSVVV